MPTPTPVLTPVDQVRLIDFTDDEPETGMGFNSKTLVFPGTALTFPPGSPDPAETGQVVQGHAVIINSHEELMDRIGVSVAVSGRYGLAAASAKVDFSKATGFNSSSTFVLAEAAVRNPIVRGKNFMLTPAADTLLNGQHNPDGFKTAFGDSFVRGIKSGGEFFAVFRLTSMKQETQQTLASSLAGEINGLFVEGSFRAAFNTAHDDQNERSEVEISFYQAAGSGVTAQITLNVDDIMTRLKNFPAIARDNPFPFKAEIATYDTIPIATTTPVEDEDYVFSMRQDENKKLDYIKRKNDVDFAVLHPEYFDDLSSVTDLQSDSEVYTQLINAVMRHQVALAKGQFSSPEVFDPAKVGLTEPAPRQFKRKAATTVGGGPVTVNSFFGTWLNTNAQSNLLKLIVSPSTTPNHAQVQPVFIPDLDAAGTGANVIFAEFDPDSKIMNADHGQEEFSFHCLLAIGQTPGALIVTHQLLFLFVDGQLKAKETNPSVDTFRLSVG